jgi:hypothetical protein
MMVSSWKHGLDAGGFVADAVVDGTVAVVVAGAVVCGTVVELRVDVDVVVAVVVVGGEVVVVASLVHT